MKRVSSCIFTLVILAAVLAVGASARALNMRDVVTGIDSPLIVAKASIAVRCPLSVGGSFEAKTNALAGELSVNPEREGEIDGALEVDLNTLETGISLRDAHMRENYLEVQRGAQFTTATLSRISFERSDLSHPTAKRTFRGVLALHGETREVTGTAEIRRSGKSLEVQASFPVKVSDFSIPSPTYLGIGVRNEVIVAVSFQTASRR